MGKGTLGEPLLGKGELALGKGTLGEPLLGKGEASIGEKIHLFSSSAGPHCHAFAPMMERGCCA